jgi:predicted kinase
MTELIIMRGLPGCGKSTWAGKWVAEDPTRRAEVNRDALRAMLHNGVFLGMDTEGQVQAVRDAAVVNLLKRGVSVVSSDTNLPRRNVRDLIRLARLHGAEWRIEDLTDVPLETCLSRNTDREDKDPVPEQVILNYHKRYIAGQKWRPIEEAEIDVADEYGVALYVHDFTLPPAIIVDIDGTVALKGSRDPYDESRVSEDRPNRYVVGLVKCLNHLGYRIIFLSGRSDNCEEATRLWLRAHIDPFGNFELHMREAGDGRKDWMVKNDLFNEHVRGKYDVFGVFDDRDQVVKLWREMGLQCYQVADGNF